MSADDVRDFPDLGDGMRARVEELEQRIASAVQLCEQYETEPACRVLGAAARGYRLSTAVRDALRGDQ